MGARAGRGGAASPSRTRRPSVAGPPASSPCVDPAGPASRASPARSSSPTASARPGSATVYQTRQHHPERPVRGGSRRGPGRRRRAAHRRAAGGAARGRCRPDMPRRCSTWAVAVLLPLSALLALAAPALSDFMLGAAVLPGGGRPRHDGCSVIFAPQVALYGIGIVLAGRAAGPPQLPRARARPAALQPRRDRRVRRLRRSSPGPASSPEAVSDAAVLVLAGGTTLGVVVLSLPLLVPACAGRGPAAADARASRRARSGGSRPSPAAGMLALLAQQAAVLVTLWLADEPRRAPARVNVYAYIQAVYLLPVCRAGGAGRDVRLPGAGPRGGDRPPGTRHACHARCRPSSCCAAVPPRCSSPSPAPSGRSSRPRPWGERRGRRRPGRAPRDAGRLRAGPGRLRRRGPAHPRALCARASRPGRARRRRRVAGRGRCGRSSRCPTTRVPPAPSAASVRRRRSA